MEDFLHKLQLSENAMKIYIKCIGELPLTRDEIGLIIPELDQQQLSNVLKELLNLGILVPIYPKNSKLLTHYSAIAPLKAISNYYKNIDDNVKNIKIQLSDVLEKFIDSVFKKSELIELDSVYDATQELRKDIEEDTIIQKQDAEDIVEGMENLRILSDALNDLHDKIKGTTQAEFGNLIKVLPLIENELKEKVETKKNKRELIEFIETIFKESFDKMVSEFTVNLHELIKKDFENTIESMNTIMNSTFQFRDDFKMLLLNMINNFELKMNSIIEIVKNKNEALDDQKQQFKQLILENLKKINENSINSIVSLNDPIKQVMANYLNTFNLPEKERISHIYQVYSLTKVKSEMESFINNSQNDLILIIPIIENLISQDQFKGISSTLKIKLASSEAHTNSIVKTFKEIAYLEYRTLKNSSLIALKGDEDHLLIGVIQTNCDDKFHDFVGLITDFPPLVKLLEPVITSLWQIGSSDIIQPVRSVKFEEDLEVISDHLKSQPISPIKSQTVADETSESREITQKPEYNKVNKISEIDDKKNKDMTKSIQGFTPISKIPIPKESIPRNQRKSQPEVGDRTGILINNAFNTLIQKLPSMKGTKFSEEMQDIANLILEKKGFSVTLHKVRSLINQFKSRNELLNELDIKQIIASIEDWKSHLL